MKTLVCFSLFSVLMIGCKTEKKEITVENEIVKAKIIETSIEEKLAIANGFKDWKKVKELGFTFNVDRGENHFERRWVWETKTNNVTAISATDTIIYNRNKMDSLTHKTNAGFINDKYWLTPTFNLMWDKGNYTSKYEQGVIAPMSKESMNKLTIVYKNEGGYTPGDAYDFYYTDNFLIKEWVFREANQDVPSMTTSWENYLKFEPLFLATDHKNEDGSLRLYFTDIEVK